ncbi:MAG: FHA domain-containing protein [Rhodanobacteraceae bacterium]|jgi:hypothetical protein|nr:FHA domain-containing protein [Rhodanobacteraceae bacterium]
MDAVTLPAAAWIEVLTPSREVALRQRVAGPTLTVGRAWDNDLVLDDPHVAAHHLRLTRDADGAWRAEDLGSVNGLFVDDVRVSAPVELAAASVLRIGQTQLRLRTSAEPVPAERPLARGRPAWPLALAGLAATSALTLLELWLAETGEPKLLRYLAPALANAGLLLVWALGWSVLTRVFDGRLRFGLHLLVVCAGVVLYQAWEQLAALGAYALAWTALARTPTVVAWLLFAAVCYAHLRVLGPARLRLKALATAALAVLGITLHSLSESEARTNSGQVATLQRLAPPVLRLAPARSAEAFFGDAATLAAPLDAARSEALEGGEEAGE